jgi:hypothetical protein
MMDHDAHDQGDHSGEHGSGASGDHGHAGHGDQPALHGMLVVGEDEVFLSHFPMFDHPEHAYQAVLKVTFTQPGADPQAAYVNDRKAHPDVRMYTLAPETFVLADIVSAHPGQPPLRSFRARIFRGHFERGGQEILSGVEVNIEEVVHFRGFEPLSYLLFGVQGELFLAHWITRPPDFDQVLSVEVLDHQFSDEELRRGLRVAIPGRSNAIHQRLRANESAKAELQLAGSEAPGTLEIQLETGVEFYFEEGELRSPATFGQTTEEASAGF